MLEKMGRAFSEALSREDPSNTIEENEKVIEETYLERWSSTRVQQSWQTFIMLWEEEKWPAVWKNGLICKIFKKGDMRDCNSWRGVILLSVISKIFCRMMIGRMKKQLDKLCMSCVQLKQEYNGEWRPSLYSTFIDFEKVFDSQARS